MKYLIKHVNGAVISLLQLEDQVATPSGFEVISESEFNDGIKNQGTESVIRWDSELRIFEKDTAAVNESDLLFEKQSQLSRLRALSVDIDLHDKLGDEESKSELQDRFDALKVLYQG